MVVIENYSIKTGFNNIVGEKDTCNNNKKKEEKKNRKDQTQSQ